MSASNKSQTNRQNARACGREVFETERFLFDYDKSLENVVIQSQKMRNYEEILSVFGLDSFRQVRVNLFDSQEKFVNHLKNIHGEGIVIPEYCKGTFDKGEINLSMLQGSEVTRSACRIFHELIHIIYKKEFYKAKNNRIVWFDEGLAMCFSGEMSFLKNKNQVQNFAKKYILSRNIPHISELSEHGSGFVNSNYNGYHISYLCVRYLHETNKEFLNLIKDTGKIKEGENDLVQDAINFYV